MTFRRCTPSPFAWMTSSALGVLPSPAALALDAALVAPTLALGDPPWMSPVTRPVAQAQASAATIDTHAVRLAALEQMAVPTALLTSSPP